MELLPQNNRNRIRFNHNPVKEALKHFIVVWCMLMLYASQI
jgi:hypothetical protein